MNLPARIALNPILLKEMRQAVRSRFVSGAYCLFLLVLTVVTGVTLMVGVSRSIEDPGALFGGGRILFHALFVPLTLVCILFVPAYAGLRLAGERGDAHLDLQFTTRLSPGAILRGKFLSAMLLMTLMSSAALPFLMLTFRLGGIDLPSALLAMLVMLLIGAVTVLATLLLAALPGNRFWRVLLALGALMSLFWIVSMTNMAVAGLVLSGVGSRALTAVFWRIAGMIGVGAVLLGSGLYFMSVALISPPAANRALPIRIWTTVAWLVWGGMLTVMAHVHRDENYLMGWMIPGLLLSMAALALTACERLTLGRRVRLAIPRLLPTRLLVFPFFSGAAQGTVWAVLLGAATLTFGFWFMKKIDPTALDDPQLLPIMGGMLAYAFAYSQSGLLVWHFLGHRWLARRHTWVITLLLLALGCLLPLLVGLAAGTLPHSPFGAWTVGNPFALFSEEHSLTGWLFALAWCGLLVVRQVPWIVRAWLDFKPPDVAASHDTLETSNES